MLIMGTAYPYIAWLPRGLVGLGALAPCPPSSPLTTQKTPLKSREKIRRFRKMVKKIVKKK
jgi:hypothetical protein